MVRMLMLILPALALTACESLKDYRVRVDDPTQRSVVKEQPYYDYKKRETIYSR